MTSVICAILNLNFSNGVHPSVQQLAVDSPILMYITFIYSLLSSPILPANSHRNMD